MIAPAISLVAISRQLHLRLALLLAVALASLLFASALPQAGRATAIAASPSTGDVPVSILAWADLPKSEPRSAELSGVAWDSAAGTLYAIADDSPRIVPLLPSADYQTWTFGDPIAVTIPMEWDGEGIVQTPDGFIVSNEFGPSIVELDRAGDPIGEVIVPAHFTRILRNRGFEALTLSPDGRYLFTANEAPLEGDGPQPSVESGGVVRILRIDRTTGTATEYAYRTDPIPVAGDGADRGVVEMVALSASELLVMERSFIPNFGNNVRIYRVGIGGATDVLGTDNLTDATPALAKTLLVDLADLDDSDFPEQRQPQPNKILDNFEAMALGPVLPDGRRILFVVSDDNQRDTQTARILVLAVAGLP
ncbi:MAG: esterase-like activity of phytase family protein [Dehalococcoidia bacterium]